MTDEVKYLSFIQHSAETVFTYAEASYSKWKGSSQFPSQFQGLFDSIEERLKPVLSTVLVPYSLTILRFADGLVDAGVVMGSDVVKSAQSQGKVAVDNIKEKVEKTLDHEYVTDVKNSAQAKYSSAHGAIISSPTYAQLYTATLNYAKWACNLTFVRKPAEALYNTAYPRVKAVVDPVVTKAEPFVKALEEHLEPKAGNSPLVVSSASETSMKGDE